MTAAPAELEAVEHLQALRVLVSHAAVLEGAKTVIPGVVIGYVRDVDGKAHRVDLHNGGWTCRTCDPDPVNVTVCAHRLAVKYATGHARGPMVTNLGAPAASLVKKAANVQRKAAAEFKKRGQAEQAKVHTAAAAHLDDVAVELGPVPVPAPDRPAVAS